MPEKLPFVYCSLGFNLFTLSISAVRFLELWNIPDSAQLNPNYPDWLLNYLLGIVISLAIISLVALYYEILVILNLFSRKWLIVPAFCFVLWILGRSFYLFNDPDVGRGGFVYGVIDVLMLTRNVSTASEAGEMGYRVGQAFGLLGFSAIPLTLLAGASTTPLEESDESSAAAKPV